MHNPTEVPSLLLALGPSTGGIGQHVRLLYDEFSERGWRVKVVGPAGLAQTSMSGLRDDFHPLALPGSASRAVSSWSKLRQTCAEFDVVHAHGLRTGLLAARACRSSRASRTNTNGGPACVVTLHNRVLGSTAPISWRLTRYGEKLLPRWADCAIGVSPDIVASMGASAPYVPLAARPRPSHVGREETRKDLGIDPDTCLVLCVARLHPQKSLDVLINAAAQAEQRIQVVIAGDGPSKEKLAQLVAKLSAPVTLLGRRDDIGDLLAAADVAVLASAWEAIPLALHEAAYAGLPLVGSRVGGIGEIVVTGETGMLVDAGDSSELADALDELARDPALRAKLGANALAREEQVFSVDKMVLALSNIYRSVVDAGGGR